MYVKTFGDRKIVQYMDNFFYCDFCLQCEYFFSLLRTNSSILLWIQFIVGFSDSFRHMCDWGIKFGLV